MPLDQRDPRKLDEEGDEPVTDEEVAAVERGDVDPADPHTEAERAAEREEQASEG
jgi:hypothetical protein